ncbi:hypothetical protein GDO81_020710 [Engystomops pustulosus]|uniref:Uncharacterized protein n=1 Tax=Engystomops pustulosus TaxID=76066 RepID=A0AAV6ZQI6_ENGPU|nr:hypothetical protein GDO81_020710 [Engystomops pustulosus]
MPAYCNMLLTRVTRSASPSIHYRTGFSCFGSGSYEGGGRVIGLLHLRFGELENREWNKRKKTRKEILKGQSLFSVPCLRNRPFKHVSQP